MLEKEDIEGLRRARAELSDSLYHATAQRLTTFRHVSWGVLAGVFLTAAVMDAPEKMVPRLLGGFALFLFVAYKLYARSEYKSNWLQAERLCPHKVLYPESYAQPPNVSSLKTGNRLSSGESAAPVMPAKGAHNDSTVPLPLALVVVALLIVGYFSVF